MRARYIFCLRFFVVDNRLIPRRTYIVGAHARTCMMSSILFLETRYAVRRTSRSSLGHVASSSHVHTKRIEQTSFRPLIKNATAASPTRNTYCSRRGCFPTEEEKKLENGYCRIVHIALSPPELSPPELRAFSAAQQDPWRRCTIYTKNEQIRAATPKKTKQAQLPRGVKHATHGARPSGKKSRLGFIAKSTAVSHTHQKSTRIQGLRLRVAAVYLVRRTIIYPPCAVSLTSSPIPSVTPTPTSFDTSTLRAGMSKKRRYFLPQYIVARNIIRSVTTSTFNSRQVYRRG